MTTRTETERRRTARVLANSDAQHLAAVWDAFEPQPSVEYIREPEAALVMVQGRIGGAGDRFNLGEATVCRATVVVNIHGETSIGTASVLGSRPGHAEVAAIVDGMLASPLADRVLAEVIEPLERSLAEADMRRAARARSTVVNFFTVARENSEIDDEDDE